MKIERIKKAKSAVPFTPFTIRTADGREVRISHPDAVSWGPEDPRTIVCSTPDGDWDVIELALVTSLGMKEPEAAKGKGNRQ